MSVEGTTHRLPDPFLVLATQNPVEFEGTFALPQAQLDRFLLRAEVGYPDADGERQIARRHQAPRDPLDTIEPVIARERLLDVRDLVRTVRVADEVEAYARRPRARDARRIPTSSSAAARARRSPCTAPRRRPRCSRDATS